jgi:hypothetical protein
MELERRSHTSILSKRFFTVQGIDNIESLTLTFADIDIMKKDFRGSMRTFIKRQIQQTCVILNGMKHNIANFNQFKHNLVGYDSRKTGEIAM